MIALYFQLFKQDASKLKKLKGKKKKKEPVPVKIELACSTLPLPLNATKIIDRMDEAAEKTEK